MLAAHLGGAAALLAWRVPHDLPAAPPAVLLDLAPLAVAPSPESSDVPPGPKQEVSEAPTPPPKPVEKIGESALSLIQIDQPLNEEALRGLAALPAVISVKQLKL